MRTARALLVFLAAISVLSPIGPDELLFRLKEKNVKTSRATIYRRRRPPAGWRSGADSGAPNV